MTHQQIGQLLLIAGFIALWFLAMAKYYSRRQKGIKTGDFYIEDPADSSATDQEEFVTISCYSLTIDAEMARL